MASELLAQRGHVVYRDVYFASGDGLYADNIKHTYSHRCLYGAFDVLTTGALRTRRSIRAFLSLFRFPMSSASGTSPLVMSNALIWP